MAEIPSPEQTNQKTQLKGYEQLVETGHYAKKARIQSHP